MVQVYRSSRVLFWMVLWVVALITAAHSAEQKAAWQGEWEKIMQAARQEGVVAIYGPPGTERRKALVDSFQKAHPAIRVEYLGGTGRDEAPRMLAERKAGRFIIDLHIGGTTTINATLKPAGVLEPIRPYLILPEVTDPSGWLKRRLWFADDEERYNLMFQGDVAAFVVVNTGLVEKGEITSYWDLLKPKWRGRIVAADPRSPGQGGVPSVFLYSHPKIGPGFFERLFKETEITVSSDARQMVDWLAQGRYAIHLFPDHSEVKKAIDLRLPVAILPSEQFKEGVPLGVGFGSVAVLNRAPHPNAAGVYLNWLLSREGQMAWQTLTGSSSLRMDISREGLPPWIVPREGVEYMAGGLERYLPLRSEIRKLVDRALAGK